MKIAIIGAMEKEVQPILKALDSYNSIKYANNIYHEAYYHGHKLIIACSKIGKVFSAMTTSVLTQTFDIDMLLATGVAGSIRSDIKVGNLIIATKTVQHDIDITAFGNKYGEIPGYDIEITTDKKLREKAKAVALRSTINLREGIIATGDQFVNKISSKDFIHSKFGACAVDMESGSVNIICKEMNIPCLILRAISDNADCNAIARYSESIDMATRSLTKLVFSIVESL